MKDYIVIASYTGECMQAHVLPARIKAESEEHARELLRQQIEDVEENVMGECLVFESVEQIETLEEIRSCQ
jgi:hypothetical protein